MKRGTARLQWEGVVPAITTSFDEDLAVDHAFMAKHCRWLLDHGCAGIVALGSLGEGATLAFDEKVDVLRTCVAACEGRAPVVAAVSALATSEAVALAREAAGVGCRGLMILPPYVYRGDWQEVKAHVASVLEATGLECMLYNNPIAYGTDFLPEQIAELAREQGNLKAVKESSGDVRRITALRALLDDRLQVFIGIDDAVVEALNAGAAGWIAGLANALPAESVALFNRARVGGMAKAASLYRWFLPLLRMDTQPKFVQLIKLVQEEVAMGTARVRAPRLPLSGAEREEALAIIRTALRHRPEV